MDREQGRGFRAGSERGFSKRLKELKHEGCLTVVSGDVPISAFRTLARRQFGRAGHDPRRYRIMLQAQRFLEGPDSWLPEDCSFDGYGHHLLDLNDAARSTAASASSLSVIGAGAPAVEPAYSEVEQIAGRYAAKHAEDAPGSDGLDPGQLRVILWSLPEFVSSRSEQRATDLARQLRSLVHQHRGIGALLVPEPNDHDLVGAVRGESDMSIRLQTGPSRESYVHQRYVIHSDGTDGEVRSQQIPL